MGVLQIASVALSAVVAAVVSVLANPYAGLAAGGATLAVLHLASQRTCGGSAGPRPRPSKTSSHPVALNPEEKTPFRLVEREVVSHDTRRFRFALQSPNHILGLPVGKHMWLSAKIDDKLVLRAYTPVSSDDDVGFFDLVVKVYFANVNPRFPDGGKMSQYLEGLKLGDTIDVRGPAGVITYRGNGFFSVEEKKSGTILETRHATHLGFIAGGTGITPILQIIRDILKHPEDPTNMTLLFANQTEEDILLRGELEQCTKDPRFTVWYTLDRPPANWKYSTGFINEQMVRERLPPAGAKTQILMCGPPVMVERACLPSLTAAGFSEQNWLIF